MYSQFKIDSDINDKFQMTTDEAYELCSKWDLLGRVYNPKARPGSPYQLNDANETTQFARQLEYMKKVAYNRLYPEYKNSFYVPVNTEAPTGTEEITYESSDRHGEAHIGHHRTSTFPQVDISTKQTTKPVHTIDASAIWTLKDIRNSMVQIRSGLTSSNRPLSARKTEALVQAINQAHERIVSEGSPDGKIDGFFNNTNLPSVTISGGKWDGKTADQITADVNGMIKKITGGSKTVHIPNTLIMDTNEFLILNSIRIPNTGLNLKTYIEEVNKHFGLKIYAYPRVTAGVTSGNTRMIMYQRDPRMLTQEIPQPLEIFPPQLENLSYKVLAAMDHAGVFLYYQGAFAKAEFAAS